MSERSSDLLLEDIVESAGKILRYTEGMTFEQFAADEKTVDAVIRNFEIIGEASGRLPEGFRSTNNQLDWKKIRGFRNRIVHDYFGVDLSIVWNIIQAYIPDLIEQIGSLNEPDHKR